MNYGSEPLHWCGTDGSERCVVDIERAFHCSLVTVNNRMQRYRQTGQTSDRPRTGIYGCKLRVTTPMYEYVTQTVFHIN